MDNLWVVVAHQSGVRIFSRNRPTAGIKLIESWDHPTGRLRDHDFNSDRHGRNFAATPSPASTGRGVAGRASLRHGYSSQNMPHETEAIRFSQQIAHYLETARAQNRFFRLVLVAGPEELGLLNQALDKVTQEQVAARVSKNLSWVKDSEIEDHIFDALADVDEKIAVQRSA